MAVFEHRLMYNGNELHCKRTPELSEPIRIGRASRNPPHIEIDQQAALAALKRYSQKAGDIAILLSVIGRISREHGVLRPVAGSDMYRYEHVGKHPVTATIEGRNTKLARGDKIEFPAAKGIFDSDGGLRGNSIEQSTASLKLRNEVSLLLKQYGFSVIISEWINKKYNRKYYDWKIRRLESIRGFVLKIPLRNVEKLNRIKERFGLNAGGEI